MAVCRGSTMAKRAHDGRSNPPALRAALSLPRGRGEKARKGAKFRGNKATIWFRISKLNQNWPKNKANRSTLAQEIAVGYSANPKNKANF